MKIISKRLSASKGFTIIELMFTVTIMTIILALAAPNISTFIKKQSIRASAQKITGLLNRARNEAVTNAINVRVCWNETAAEITRNTVPIPPGFMVAIDRSNNQLVKMVEYAKDNLSMRDDRAGNCFLYNSYGRPNADLNIAICQAGDNSTYSQALTMNRQGRVILQDNDGGVIYGCN